ncbi:MAG: 1-(5-phosphoribosyl)-5-[(5-phosphoribosylamino)methylideneamino]imidazole-4-carboxamide isomerase [Planctomycetota bacterium]
MPEPTLTIYPSIDLRDGRVVRLKQGDYDRQITYDVDPHDIAASYEQAGATWLHVVDLDGAKAGAVQQAKLIGEIAAKTTLQVQCGGGVRSEDDIRQLLDAGAARVVVGTAAVQNLDWFLGLLQQPDFADQLTLAIDAKTGMVATHAWQQTSDLTALDLATRMNGLPLGALLYTDVARDGMLGGSDVARTVQLAEATDVPVLASGGIGQLDDLKPLVGTAVHGVVVGRSLYEGKLDLREAVELGARA